MYNDLNVSTYVFGQDITFWFYPFMDNELAVISADVQSQTPDIYIFTWTSIPTREQALSGTDALQHITSWTWHPVKNAWSFTITAIEDPEPTAVRNTWNFYIAVNFILKLADVTKQTVIMPLEIGRIQGQGRSVSVVYSDLAGIYSQINACSTTAQQTEQIAQAVKDIKARLKFRGYEWSKINKLDELNRAVALRAVSLIMLSQLQAGNDKYGIKYAEYKAMYETEMESLQLEYDQNSNGEPDQDIVPANNVLWVAR